MLKRFLKKQDQQFGFLCTSIGILIFFYQLLILDLFSIFTLGISILFLVLTILSPGIFYYPSKIWMKLGYVLGIIFTPIILSMIYLLTVIPVSLFLKIFNYDILKKKKSNQNSYWIKRNHKTTNFKDQF